MASGTTPERPAGTVKARIRFFNNIENVDSYRIDLPWENWKKTPRGGYRYRSKDGTCSRVNIRLGKRVSASCHNVKHLVRFVSEGQSLYSVLTLNRVRHCATFDDFIDQGAGKMCNYVVKVTDAKEVDAELIGWIKAAYESAG